MWYNTIKLESKRHTGRREAKSSHHLKWLFPLFLLSQGVHCSPSWHFCTMWMTTSVFLPHCGIAALQHFFRKCHTIILLARGRKEGKKLITKHRYSYVHFLIILAKNLIGYGVFRKHPISCVYNFISTFWTVFLPNDPFFAFPWVWRTPV